MKNCRLFLMMMCVLSSGILYAQEDKKSVSETDSLLRNVFLRMQKEFETPREPELPKPYLDNGSAFPDFVYQDINGKEISSKTLRGKYVYIDFWATWCGPCAKELPPLKELEEKMEGKNIVFVSISCDRVRADWEKVVKEKELGGIQLHIGNDQKFFDTYRTYYIPHFMLIDRKGKIIDSHTTRPSDPETEKTLMGLKGI